MSAEQYESPLTAVKFARRENRGLFLGRSGPQIAVLVSMGLLCTVLMIAVGFPHGLLAALPVAAFGLLLAFGEAGGRSFIDWIKLVWRFAVAELQGQNTFTIKPDTVPTAHSRAAEIEEKAFMEATRRAAKEGREAKKKLTPNRLSLPGEGSELLIYEMPEGEAMVYDPRERSATIVCRVRSEAFDLADDGVKADRVQVWSEILAGLGAHAGVAKVQVTVQTLIAPASEIREHYVNSVEASGAGPTINALAHQSYLDLVDAAATMTRHEQYVSIVLDASALRREIKSLGGGLDGLMVLAVNEMRSLSTDLADGGAEVERWLGPRELARVIREAYDPESASDVADRRDAFAGVAPESAGPMGVRRSWDKLHTDSAVHKTYWVSEWPRRNVMPGFISPLIFAGDFRHTVTLVARPKSAARALSKVEGALNDQQAADRIRAGWGQVKSLAQQAETDDLIRREEELVAGHGDVDFSGYVTITAPDEEELAAASSKLRHAAAQSFLEIRNLVGQQAEGFIASALPLGRGIKK